MADIPPSPSTMTFYAITTTSGAIKGKVAGIEPYETQDGAFRKVLEQCLLKFLVDLQVSGAMGR
jgi:hypothetical protein